MAKTVDTWKTKGWYQVLAPEVFGSKILGEIPATEDRVLINRIMKTGLDELTGDMSQSYSTVNLRIVDVKGKNAYTKFIGHELSPNFLKTFIKRRRTLIDDIVDVKTSDGETLRIKLIVFTAGKIARGTEAQVRTTARSEILSKTSGMTLNQLLQEIFFKKFAVKLIPSIKKIVPIKRIEIRKTELKEMFAK